MKQFFCTLLALFAGTFLMAQGTATPDVGDGLSSDTYGGLAQFMEGIEWVYGFFVIVSGYLSTFIPGLNKIDKAVYRVLAVAIVIGAGFYFGAGSNLFNLVITYTVSTSFYETILKLFRKTPEVTS